MRPARPAGGSARPAVLYERRLRGHTSRISSAAFSLNGKILASGCGNPYDHGSRCPPGEVKLWDVSTGRELATFYAPSGKVMTVDFAPDGMTVASGTGDLESGNYARKIAGDVTIWDVATGRARATLHGHENLVSSVAFSPDGRMLASGSYDGTVRLWDPATGLPLGVLRCPPGGVTTVAFAPDGMALASGGGNDDEPGQLVIWDLSSREERANLAGHTAGVVAATFSPDGRLLASGGHDKRILIHEVDTWELRAELTGHMGPVWGIAFSPDSRILASVDMTRNIRLWELATGRKCFTIRLRRNRPVVCVAFAPDGNTLAAGDRVYWGGGDLHIWNVAQLLGKK